jgi:hypothetical protein
MSTAQTTISEAFKTGIIAGLSTLLVTVFSWTVALLRKRNKELKIVKQDIEVLKGAHVADKKYRQVMAGSQMAQMELLQTLLDRSLISCEDCPIPNHADPAMKRAQESLDREKGALQAYLKELV